MHNTSKLCKAKNFPMTCDRFSMGRRRNSGKLKDQIRLQTFLSAFFACLIVKSFRLSLSPSWVFDFEVWFIVIRCISCYCPELNVFITYCSDSITHCMARFEPSDPCLIVIILRVLITPLFLQKVLTKYSN